MCEMLANHYFLVHNFPSAKSIYNSIWEKEPNNKVIVKKLIICCIATGEYKKALDLFLPLIRTDIDLILSTDSNSDDCPCPQLINQIEKEEKLFESNIDKLTALGMLWLYCNPSESLNYFRKVSDLAPEDERYSKILNIIKNKVITSTIH